MQSLHKLSWPVFGEKVHPPGKSFGSPVPDLELAGTAAAGLGMPSAFSRGAHHIGNTAVSLCMLS